MSFSTWGAAALRALPPETAHELAITGLEMGLGPRAERRVFPELSVQVAGLTLPNPLGLAAGFDKDARAPDAMLACGFGFVEVGTVTPVAQPGNPRPRLFRLAEDGGVINRMGFNNAGLAAFTARLQARKRVGIVGANIGANKDTPDRIGDYVTGLARAWPHADYVTINISSPNTPGLRTLQGRDALENLLTRVGAERAIVSAAHGPRPLFLKMAPDLDEAAIRDVVEGAIAGGVDGLIVSNTTLERPAHLRSANKGEAGGLSGRPAFEISTRALKIAAGFGAGRIALIGVGGVEDGATALAKIRAGASAVQLYTAMAIGGPALIGRILTDLTARLKAEGFASVKDAIGAG